MTDVLPHRREPASASDLLIAAAFQLAPQAVWLLAQDGTVLGANDAARAWPGTVDAIGTGRAAWTLDEWGDEGARALREACEEAAAGREPTPFVAHPTHTEGERIVDVAVTAFHVEGGRYLRVDALDVTARAAAEEELRASRATFQGILAIAADAIISTDAAMTVVHFNRGAEQIFGWEASEVIGRPLDMLLPERIRRAHHAHVAQFGRSQESARRMGERREIFGRRRNGEEFPAEASISRLDAGGGRQLFTVVLRDVTERHRIEAGQRFLAEASQTLARSLDVATTLRSVVSLPVPRLADACILDVMDIGGAVRRVASTSEDPARERALRTLETHFPIHPDSPSRVVDVLRTGRAELVAAVTDDRLEATTENAEHLANERALGAASLMLVPLVRHERPFGVITLIAGAERRAFDEADLQLAEEFAVRAAFALDNAGLHEAAQRATRARDDVLGIVSHDLRNPLSAIGMCARVLLESPPEDEEARRDLLTAIYQSTGLANRMIQDLLDVSQIEAGRLSVERHAQRVDAMLALATPMFESQAAEREIALRVDVPADLPPVLADEGRILQVLANLVGNATKFTEPGGTVTIGARRRDGDVVLSVADTGTGIPEAQRALVFERYWHDRRNARRRGTGLGLAIAKGIVEAHDGTIWVESAEGHGSTFYFSLPVADTD